MKVNIGDVNLFFDVEGAKLVADGADLKERPTLLLLHGGPGMDHVLFKPHFAELADVAQVVFFDHRGNGRSDHGEPVKWNVNQWADDVRAFCEALDIEKPIVLGISFGGLVAMAYASRYPGHPGKLILTSTQGHWRLDRVLNGFERLGGAEAREVARRFLENPGPLTHPDYIRVCIPLYTQTRQKPRPASILNSELFVAHATGEMPRISLLPDLNKIRCPTLVVAGQEDPVAPVESHDEIVAAMDPDIVRYERFPGCGHAVFRDNPKEYFDLVRRFILAV